MQIFLDTGLVEELKEVADLGIIDGVTTNPSLIAKSGRDRDTVIREMAELVNGPISGEVISTEAAMMIEEGKKIAAFHPNMVIKLPLTMDGIKACSWFTKNNIKTNVTLCFSPNQALLAAKAGATYVSPFVGRLDDIGQDGIELIRQIRKIYDIYGFKTKILSASIRHPEHVRLSALAGAHVGTMPLKVVKDLFAHPLTKLGLEQFLKDFEKSKK
jgi:transaldolase